MFFSKGGNKERDKERLSNIMAYGEDLPPIDMQKIQKKMEGVDLEEEKKIDRFDEC